VGSPEVGDVAVFRFPQDPRLDYIKRVVGLPGDEIIYSNKTLFINGEEIKISGQEAHVVPGTDDIIPGVVRRKEQLFGVQHEILVKNSKDMSERRWVVPEGMYFMVGDNRDNSNDSRYWGFVPEENLVGKARYIWMHWNGGVLWSRLGDRIQ